MKRLLFLSTLVLWVSVPAVASSGQLERDAELQGNDHDTHVLRQGRRARVSCPPSSRFPLRPCGKWDGAEIFTSTSSGQAQIVEIRNKEPFSISWTPPAVPPEQLGGCASGTWIRWDSNTQQPGIVYDVVALFVFQPQTNKMLTYQVGEVYPG